MARTTTYAFQNVQATLNGLKIDGFADGDDAVMVERGVARGTGQVGADGTAIWSQTSNRSATITFRLWSNSITHKRLMDLFNQQENGQLGTGFPFDVVDTGTNEGGTADQCYIETAPAPHFGEKAVAREWVLWTGEWQDNTIREIV